MKNLILGTSVMFLVLFSAGSMIGQKSSYVQNELLVKFAPGVTKAAAARTMRFGGAGVLETLGDLGWVRIRLPTGMEVKSAVVSYSGLPDVIAVQPNYYYRLQNTPNDPLFNQAAPNDMYGLLNISAPAAWNLTTGSSDVVVADIDTGMRYTHEDLAPNVWTNPGEIPNNGIDDDGNGFVDDYHGFDFRFNNPDPVDQFGHGTHTAGTIGAAGNNGLGVVGVNWNVKIMPIRIFGPPPGDDTTTAMVINAYNYVRMMKDRGVNIRVTNNSYGGAPENPGSDQAVKDALDALGNAGVLNVFAAGNAHQNIDQAPFYPASYDSPSILSVAASIRDDTKASFSNYGPVSVDLAAPGAIILSTTFDSDSSYGFMSGTSMATPHVAGAAALLSALNPSLTPASLKATLMNTVDQLPQWNGLVKSGGRLNIANALQNQTVCSYQLASNSIVAANRGGYVSLSVTAPPNCDFSVKSNAFWIHVYTGAEMSGTSTITFRVTINPTITRQGTITIAGQTVTVIQSRVLS